MTCSPQTSSPHDTPPRSNAFHCGGRGIKFLAVIPVIVMTVGMVGSVCSADHASSHSAGIAKVDITPDEAFISAKGESWRLPDPPTVAGGKKTPPANILDPIFARVLVLKSAETSLAIVSLDLILFSSKKVITEAKAKWKIDHVILSSSHTHTSTIPRGLCPTGAVRSWGWDYFQDDPGVTVDWPGLSEDPWYAATEAKIVAAIGEASSNLFPAQVLAGRGPFESAYMAHNRRLVGADGKVTDMWDNPKRLPTKPVDPTVGVMQVNDRSGKPRAFLVHYACHPVGLMGSGVLSRDFPGAMVDYVEQELGSDCMAMFLQGAAGDLDPYDMRLRGEHGFNLMRQTGISLGKGALRVAKTLKPRQDAGSSSIKVKENLVKLPHRNGGKVTEACVMTAVINDDLALVTIPGEPFIQHQLDLTAKSPLASTFLLGYAYCGAGSPFLIYVPTVQAVKEGGYGADVNRCSFVSGDAGERMVNTGVTTIKELLARDGTPKRTEKP